MAFIIKDRVKEGTISTGTGAIDLSGPSSTFAPFNSFMTDGDTTYYAIVHTTSGVDEWEVGLGTWNTGNTITRTTILSGSNGTSAVDFSDGIKDVFMTYPASVASYTDGSGDLSSDIGLGNHSTTELVEGSNLYYLDSRVDAHLSGGTGVTYTSGVISIGQDVSTTSNVTFNSIVSTDGVTVGGNLAVSGDLVVSGTTTTINATELAIQDNMIYLNEGSTITNPDLGWVGNYNDGTYAHSGVFRDATDSTFKFFDGYTPEPGQAIDVTHASYNDADIKFGTAFGDITGNVTGDLTGNVTGNLTGNSSGTHTGSVVGNVTGNSSTATKLATARTVQLSGDVTGSATFDGSANINITAAVQDDSHSHVISNVDGLQTALDSKAPTARIITAGTGITGGGDLTANRTISLDTAYTDGRYYTESEIDTRMSYTLYAPQDAPSDLDSISQLGWYKWANTTPANAPDAYGMLIHGSDGSQQQQLLQTYGGSSNQVSLYGRRKTSGVWDTSWTQYFSDHYHPNADKLTTARNIALTGAVTGSVNFDGSGNVSITTTATADPTLTLSGDASGSATFTNLGNATLSVTVADDSHNHVWGNIDGASVGTLAGPRFTTASGYIEFGPANASWAHIYTDRPDFYFNKGANFQGNITLTGTVDGRDVAADGTKLDGIEAGATADQVGLVKGAAIGASANLNTYTTDGYFHQNSNASAAAGTNYPVALAGMLSVQADGSMVYQKYQTYSGDGTWQRTKYVNTWYAWDKILDTGNAVAFTSADNTKLDGIEAGATADQTAAQLLTAIKTVDGAGSGLDADLLDGLSEASFMRRSANSGLDMNNNSIVGVNQIIHEGDTNTYIQFHAADQFRVVTGGTERLEVNNTRTQIDTLAVTGTLNGGTPSTSASAVGSVGSYAMLVRSTPNADVTTGTTYAGSGLLYCGFFSYPTSTGNGYYSNRSGSPAGTWRAMGYNNGNPVNSSGGFYQGTIFLRIS